MPETDQGNGNQGQEPGAGTQGQGQEPGQQQEPGQEPGQQGQQGNGQQQSGQEPGSESPPDFASMSEADLRSYAAKLHGQAGEARREAANYRTRATAAEQKVTEAERAQMSEQERITSDLTTAQSRVAELEGQVTDLTRGAALRQALSEVGALNPATAFKVGAWDNVKVEGDVVDLESFKKAEAALRKSDPYLFRRGASADAGEGRSGGTPETGASINDAIRGVGRR